jgi:hypothetical protein
MKALGVVGLMEHLNCIVLDADPERELSSTSACTSTCAVMV